MFTSGEGGQVVALLELAFRIEEPFRFEEFGFRPGGFLVGHGPEVQHDPRVLRNVIILHHTSRMFRQF